MVKFEYELRPIEELIDRLAHRYHMRTEPSASRGWPGRTLKKRQGLKTYEFVLSLSPEYINTGRVSWDIHDVWMYDFGEIFRKTIRFQRLAEGVDLRAPAAHDTIMSAVAGAGLQS